MVHCGIVFKSSFILILPFHSGTYSSGHIKFALYAGAIAMQKHHLQNTHLVFCG